MLLLLAACAGDEHTVRKTITVDEREREYLLHVPPSREKDGPAALVVVLHGGGGNAAQAERFTGFSRLSDREGFIVVYPDAVEKNWNDGRGAERLASQKAGVDDVKYIGAMIDAVAREHDVDPKRIYATGASNGGIMSQYLAIKLSGRFAAIGCVIGSIAEPAAKDFKPGHPVSVLIMNGTEDPLVPFDGGVVARNRGEVIATREAAGLWIEHNGCGKEAKKEDLPDKDADDACTVTRETWSGGRDGSEVVLYTIKGGGHTWPGGSQYAPRAVIGRVCRDLDATGTIWEFFQAHPKK